MMDAHPVLTREQALDLESRRFAGREDLEWQAMVGAGTGVAREILRDFREIGGLSAQPSVLVLAGKGHNAGDALIAAREILLRHPETSVGVVFVFGERNLRPLSARAWKELRETAPERVHTISLRALPAAGRFDLTLDGLFGFQFRPPLDDTAKRVLAWETTMEVRLRAAIDLPSGLDAPGAFRADFTYATGSVKSPLLTCGNSGRLRYVDLGFFDTPDSVPSGARDFVLTASVLAPLRRLRSSASDKRSYGHCFIVGGSGHYPGAVLMCVLAALRSGAGLVTAFVPRSLAAPFAARAPEAMWLGCPETPDGGLALEGFTAIQHQLGRGSSLVIGPGLGREPETIALAEALVKNSTAPLVLDADSLQPSIIRAGRAPRILTPHAGEYLRIARGLELDDFARETGATVVLKGPVTLVASGGRLCRSFFGGPVLARGGSGDLLAGLVGGLLAQAPADLAGAARRAVVLHGLAADSLARADGQVAVAATDLLRHLPDALRAYDVA